MQLKQHSIILHDLGFKFTISTMKEQTILLLMGLLAVSFSMKTLYVRPTEMPSHDCPTNGPCETLDKYRDNSETYFNANEIQVIFLPGSYHSSIEEGLNIFDKKALLIQGTQEKIIFNRIEMLFFNIETVKISDIIINEVDLSLYSVSKVSIINSTFMQSMVNLDNTNTEIHNSHFKDYHNYIYHKRVALELISSNVTFIGINSFRNNTGNKGGALSMENSKIIFKEYTITTFQDNTATKYGGAIFVQNENLCLYQVHLELNATSKLVFDNNRAVKGGDNIYGASLMSNCSISTSKSHHIVSSQVWRNYFIFTTTNHLSPSLSLVSAESKRVCLCDNNGHPKCTKKEYILLLNETAFPGEVLTLQVILVGGDFGATIRHSAFVR